MIEQFQKAQGGCRNSLKDFLHHLEETFYQTAYYVTERQQDAMDATQKALVYVYRHAKEVQVSDLEGKQKVWEQKLIVQACFDLSKERSKVVSMLPHLTRDNLVKKLPGNVSFVASLKRAIYELPERPRFILVLRYIQNLTIQEIAEVLGISVESVKKQLYRARKQLQEWLSDYQEGGLFQWQIHKS
ncbi:RNA polymerase sigma factor [Thermoactinomyces sp. DSM 45892]|uniref:RNA polymerase sigma factor n=1 Tax=Thermoactinomyces sp. DSM 45892 TaxID=1882753 RepID=UPI00089C05ED|nr:RNA polymerase sigma factor [Thermoactinomyces sp. DSM 45892]SDZ24691.1 RNA polymerase sigma-70 factor, ECF subfamily [Thermoactinomyces sp. DSM 45892]